MRLQTQAEIFIQTLQDMPRHDRARQMMRLRRQLETHVERFMIGSRANPDGGKWDRAGTGTRKAFADHPQQCRVVSRSAARGDGGLNIGGGLTDAGPGAPLDSPFRRFAAQVGVPIHLDGAVIGAPWALDRQPGDWSARDISQPKSFAALAADERGHSRLIRSAERRTSDLSSAHARALRTCKAKPDVVTSMKHEIASPLTAIFGYADPLIAQEGRPT